MHLAIIHYHLNRGGVTQVIGNQLRALSAADATAIDRVLIFYGGRQDGWPDRLHWPGRTIDVQLVQIDPLEYDSLRDDQAVDGRALADELLRQLGQRQMHADNTVLHVHNHALGKNCSLTAAIWPLAEAGYRQLLQIHDFAEDFRPQNYRNLRRGFGLDDYELAGRLYPCGESLHYAVLNERDLSILRPALNGTSPLHLLPNPVQIAERLPDPSSAWQRVRNSLDIVPNAAMVTYPVRGIRRKNVGEMLLWSALAKSFATFCITLRPLNPAESISYDRWQQLAERLKLSCRFDIGAASSGMSFAEVIAASDNVITTSVAEGFGMVFLEAHLFARPLLGRDLPEITSQFKQAGLDYPLLAEQLRIPRHLVDCRQARDTLVTCFRQVAEAFGHWFDDKEIHRQAEQLCQQDTIDFALLDTDRQAELIESIAAPGGPVAALCDANPVIAQFFSNETRRRHADITVPAQIIEENFGLVTSGHRLADLYQRVLASDSSAPPCPAPAGEKVLESFLSLQRLHPIRVQ